jgi:hypothetical protein
LHGRDNLIVTVKRGQDFGYINLFFTDGTKKYRYIGARFTTRNNTFAKFGVPDFYAGE